MTALSDDRINAALDAAMLKFDWAITKNNEVMKAEDSYRLRGFADADKDKVLHGQKALHDQIARIKEMVRADLEASLSKTKPCAEDEKYKRVMFAGPYGGDAADLMRKAGEGIDTLAVPVETKQLLQETKGGLVVDMDALRQKVPGFDALYANDPGTASSIARSVVSAWTWAYYELADKANVNIWSNETMASGVYRDDKKWLDENLRAMPLHIISVLPPAEGRLQALRANNAAIQAKTGASIPEAQIDASLAVTEQATLPNMQAYGWPGVVLVGTPEQGYKVAASHSPFTGIKIHIPAEVAQFTGANPPAPYKAPVFP